MPNYSRLSKDWTEWSRKIGMTNISVCENCSDGEACFKSDDESFYMRCDERWWAIDRVDDRGRRHDNTARFSTFELAEKYLIWRWGSTMRDAVGAESLGPRLYSLGYSSDVEVLSTQNQWQFELKTATGSAILPEPYLTIFSHLMLTPTDEVEQEVQRGVT